MSSKLDAVAVNTIRGLSMDAVQAANSGHPGTPMALAPLGWTIFSRLRRHDPAHPDWADRDRFVLSCGHASMLQYSLLHLTGYDVSLDEIRNFRQWGSKTPGHPEFGHTPGVETTTGPLGQGFANAVGMAMAERHLAQRFNRPGFSLFDHRVFVIASDGDLMEGVASEAASLAGHLKLGKLIVFYDDNRITIDGGTDLSFSEDTIKRFDSYGWHTESVEDGNDLDALEHAAHASLKSDRPSFIRVHTVIGYPAPTKQNTAAAHGAPLGHDEIAGAKQAMGWPTEPFHVPRELATARDEITARGATWYADWQQRFAKYEKVFPSEAKVLGQALAGELPAGWDQGLPEFPADVKGMATRKASGKVISVLKERVPNLVGGSADLTGSTNTFMDGYPDFREASGEGVPRNVYWGVREHAMAAAVNGMALHGGVIPFGATFLIFSDYMRPSIRLAALMNVPARYVFTHDSIGLGEDGPTHQPVEQLSSLRAIPGMTVLRPADANETRECWKAMLGRSGPAALVLTRQDLPTLDRTDLGSADGALRGAYVLAATEDPEVILIGTGSEVHLALEAHYVLVGEGIRSQVVSMPSWELFAEQSESYRRAVLPPTVKARVVVEAGVRHGWERWIGDHGAYVTLDRFGASAPYERIYQELGLTAGHVVSATRSLLGRPGERDG